MRTLTALALRCIQAPQKYFLSLRRRKQNSTPMGKEVLEIIDSAADDDEISVLYAKPVSVKKGTSKLDAIPVEDHPIPCRPRSRRRVIDLSQDYDDDGDEVKLLFSFPETPKKLFKGESSNTKSPNYIDLNIPLTLFVCEICADEKPTCELFRILDCVHSYCSECIGKYVASKLQENITSIGCPVSGCGGYFEPQHCRSILPKQVFERWGDALCEAVILAAERFYCPYKDCSALLIDDCRGGYEVIMRSECPECNRLFCVQCKVPWHSGMTCAEFQKLDKDERSNEDIMLMNLAKMNRWVRCPQCKFYVSKSEGCLFMRCRCGYSFCYNCGAPLKQHYCHNCKH